MKVDLSTLSIKQKVQLLRYQLNKVALEREFAIDVMLAGVITRLPVCLHGKPGTGKTMIAELIAKAIAGRYSYILNNQSMKPGELYGVADVKELKENSRLVYNTEGKPPSSHIIVSDEIGKAPSWAMNAQLRMMNEKRGPNNEQLDIFGYFFATNEPFASQSPAFADRMVANVLLENVREWENRLELKRREIGESDNPRVIPNLLTIEELAEVGEMVMSEVSASDCLGLLNSIEDALRVQNPEWEVSTRKANWILRMLKAIAWLRGETSISHDLIADFYPCAIWNDPKDIVPVTDVITKKIDEVNKAARETLSSIKKAWKEFQQFNEFNNWSEEKITDFLSVCEEAITLSSQYQKEGADPVICDKIKDFADSRILEVRSQMDEKLKSAREKEIESLRVHAKLSVKSLLAGDDLPLELWNEAAEKTLTKIDNCIEQLSDYDSFDSAIESIAELNKIKQYVIRTTADRNNVSLAI